MLTFVARRSGLDYLGDSQGGYVDLRGYLKRQDGVFVFEKENSNHLWLFDSGSRAAKQLAVAGDIGKTSWVYNGGLVFVTDQGYKSESESGKYGENYIRLMDVKSVTTFIVGVYHPDEDSYTRVELTDKISKMPDELIATGNGQNIYFKSGEEIFQIILRKF